MGCGVRRDEDRPAVRAALHVPQPAFRLRPGLPPACRAPLETALAAQPDGMAPPGRRRPPDARRAARRQPLRTVPGHVGRSRGADHRLPAARDGVGGVALAARASAAAAVGRRGDRARRRGARGMAQDGHSRGHVRQPGRHPLRARRRNRRDALSAPVLSPRGPQGCRGGAVCRIACGARSPCRRRGGIPGPLVGRAPGRDRVPRRLRLHPRRKRAQLSHAPWRGDARGGHDVPSAGVRRCAGGGALRRAAERARARRDRGDLPGRRDDGMDTAAAGRGELRKEAKRTLQIVYFVVLNCLGHIAFVGVRMTTSLFALGLGGTEATVGVLMALFALLPMLLSVSAGRLIDRIGPRRPLVAAFALLAAGAALPFAAPQIATLYISCTLVGTAFMFIHIAMNSVFGAYGTAEERAVTFSWLALGFSISSSIGPVVAGFAIDHLGHAEAMLMLAAFPVVGGVLVWGTRRPLPRPEPVAHVRRSGVIDLLRIQQLRNTFIVSVLLAMGWDLYTFLTPLYGARLRPARPPIRAIIRRPAAPRASHHRLDQGDLRARNLSGAPHQAARREAPARVGGHERGHGRG